MDNTGLGQEDQKGPTANSAVCSEHFTADCFDITSATAEKLGIKIKQRLRAEAVPTIFPRLPSESFLSQQPRTSRAQEKRGLFTITYLLSYVEDLLSKLIRVQCAGGTKGLLFLDFLCSNFDRPITVKEKQTRFYVAN